MEVLGLWCQWATWSQFWACPDPQRNPVPGPSMLQSEVLTLERRREMNLLELLRWCPEAPSPHIGAPGGRGLTRILPSPSQPPVG